jgi:spermidine synthase
MAIDQAGWFSEALANKGCAFSLRTTSKLHEERSPYQHIEIYATETFGNLMVIDGSIMLTARDNFFYHEMMSHPALFTHPAPRRVCIVGGGDCGTLQEVLKHPEVEQVTQVDIDERVTRLAERYFPELTAGNGDPRARLLFDDGIAWVANAAPGGLDLIIVDSTDPVGPAVGLFTQGFFASCLRALAPGGMVIQQSESPLLHMDILRRMYADMRGAGFADVKTLFFPQAVYPSGWWSATMSRKGEAIGGFREESVQRRTFATRYYNAEIHRAALAQPEFFRRDLGAAMPS